MRSSATSGPGSERAASRPTRLPSSRAGPAFELSESKLHPPRVGDQTVLRAELVDRLRRATRRPIVVVCAGPGYGKTTALAQWAASDTDRRFAWVSVDRHDNDPVVLLTHVAGALDRHVPVDPGVFEALASSGASIEATVLPRLGSVIAGIGEPVVLVLDDVHAIDNPQCVDAIVALARCLAEGSQLAVSTRDRAALPLGLLRARDLTLEIGPEDLRMGEVEARALLSSTGVDASDDDVTVLVRRTEGWPAGLYLAALSARTAGVEPGEIGSLTGNDPFVVDFLRSEFLAQLPPHELRFLTEVSILEQLSGPLCDAVLETTGSAALLESLERSNRFVVALDRDRRWYRFHPLARELLATELERSTPGRVPTLLSRAFDWCAANGHETAAIAYGQAAGDTDRVAAAMERSIQPVFQSGRTATVEKWLDWLEAHDGLSRYPTVAVIGSMFHAVTGNPTAADRWADAAESGAYEGPLPDGSASIESWRALIRAVRCRHGAAAMRTDAVLAVGTLAPGSTWRPAAMVLLGMAELLTGSADDADDRFADAADVAADLGAPDMIAIALAERSLIAIAREEWVRADELAQGALWAAQHSGREAAAINALVFAVAARTALHAGRTASAHELLPRAQRRLPQLTHAVPIPSVQTRVELARAYLTLADPAGARAMVREIDAILRRCPDLGTLPAQVGALRSQLSTANATAPGVSALSAAELGVLPLLTTHLSFKEIAERVYLSPHTVKSHAISIYRKLGVTTRSDAVDRAREVGLL